MAESKIKFRYTVSDQYTPKYINGAYGGITPRGEIVVNFFFERNTMPTMQTYEVTHDGKLGHEISAEPSDISSTIERYVDTGIILNINAAKELVAWLSDKISAIEKRNVDVGTLN